CPGAGDLLVFNNGTLRPGGASSSVEELALPFAGRSFARRGLAFGPAEPVWSYRAREPAMFYASFLSGCQRLPNGNPLICDGPRGRVFEVPPDGTLAWDYWNTFGGDPGSDDPEGKALFRATRVAPDHPGLKGRALPPMAAASSQ